MKTEYIAEGGFYTVVYTFFSNLTEIARTANIVCDFNIWDPDGLPKTSDAESTFSARLNSDRQNDSLYTSDYDSVK